MVVVVVVGGSVVVVVVVVVGGSVVVVVVVVVGGSVVVDVVVVFAASVALEIAFSVVVVSKSGGAITPSGIEVVSDIAGTSGSGVVRMGRIVRGS